MPREKRPHKAMIYSGSGLVFVDPIKDVEGTWRGHVPAIEAIMPDGRLVFVTLEAHHRGKMTRDEYTRRLRILGNALIAEADRRDSDPKR